MATLEITIDSNTFAAGGALAVAYNKNNTDAYPQELRSRVVIPVGNSKDYASSGSAGFPSSVSAGEASENSMVRGAIQITAASTVFVDSAQLQRTGQWFKNTLATLVGKGIIIVRIGGVAQTPTQLINL